MGLFINCLLQTRSLCLALCLLSPLASAGEEPSKLLVVGLRETARHRGPIPPVHSVAPSKFSPADEQYVWSHVNSLGLVVDVRPISTTAFFTNSVERVARSVRYVPFTTKGTAVDAWVQDTIPLLPLEQKPDHVVPFPQTQLNQVSIELTRSACYGSCPVYKVTVHGDGRVDYEGTQYVSIPGHHQAQVSVPTVSALLDQFRESNFLALQAVYRAGWTDLPTIRLTLKMGEQTKEVVDYGGEWVGMPGYVTALEHAVDTASDSARWVSSSPATIAAMKDAAIGLRGPGAVRVLQAAVDNGDVSTARSLLQAGTPAAHGLKPHSDEDSLLEIAVDSLGKDEPGNRLEMLKLLLGYRVVRSDKADLQRALAKTVEQGDADLARELIRAGADPTVWLVKGNEDQPRRLTYLMLAAASGSWAMIDDALARPHDIHAEDTEGRTALVWALWNAPPVEDVFPIVDRLRAQGASRSELDTALLSDCNPNWIPGLVARGANLNARDKNGNTPLFQDCTPEGIKALLDAGADRALRNAAGKTVLETTYTDQDGKEDPRADLIRHYEARAKH